jgi:hypothetical protein
MEMHPKLRVRLGHIDGISKWRKYLNRPSSSCNQTWLGQDLSHDAMWQLPLSLHRHFLQPFSTSKITYRSGSNGDGVN